MTSLTAPPGEEQEFTAAAPPLAPERPTSVLPYFATPAYGGMVTLTYMQSMLSLLMGLGKHGVYPLMQTMGNESLVTRARNNCVGEFLKSRATHLCFIDADIGFHAQHIVDMLSSGLDVVFGAYPRKSIDWERVLDAARSGKAKTPEDLAQYMAGFAINFHERDARANVFPGIEKDGAQAFFEVKEGATGFCCIARKVIEAMIAAHGSELGYMSDTNENTGEQRYSLFDCASLSEGHSDFPLLALRQAAKAYAKDMASEARRDEVLSAALAWVPTVTSGPTRYLSEDYLFSRRAAALGFKIYVYAAAQLTHTGTFTFYGNFQQMFAREGDMVRLSPRAERALVKATEGEASEVATGPAPMMVPLVDQGAAAE